MKVEKARTNEKKFVRVARMKGKASLTKYYSRQSTLMECHICVVFLTFVYILFGPSHSLLTESTGLRLMLRHKPLT